MNPWEQRLRNTVRKRVLLGRVAGATLLLLLLGISLVWAQVDRAARLDNAAPSDAVVVLGCAVRTDGSPSPALRARIHEGARIWRETHSRYLLVTGGVGHYPPAEAIVMRRIAQSEGVPPLAIIDDTTAHTTEGSAFMCGRIAQRLGWQRVTLVSDPWHLLRSRRMFADYSPTLDIRQHPALASPAWTAEEIRLRYMLRECVAVPFYFAKRLFIVAHG